MTTPPDFRELIGNEGTPDELAKLRRAHDLLVAAGPPPELSPRLAEPPHTRERPSWWHMRRNQAAFGLAASVAAAAFGIGYLVGNNGSPAEYPAAGPPIPMHAISHGSLAKASIVVGERDEVGNWPLLVKVSGLKPLPKKLWYELYLTRKGKRAAYCGSFSVNDAGAATVQFSIPYHLKRFDGWIVTTSLKQVNRPVLLTT